MAKKKESAVKRVTELTREELESIVESIQGWLWVDDCPEDGPKALKNHEVWNPEKECKSCADFHQDVYQVLRSFGLEPTKIVKFDG